MLQIIGWMGCVYLFVKGLEFIANRSYRNDDGSYGVTATVGSVVSWLGAIVFFFMLNAQAGATPSFTP